MNNKENNSANNVIIRSLKERAKELRCLYDFEELFKEYEDKPLKDFFCQIEKIIPPAFQFPEICCVKVNFEGIEYGRDACNKNSQHLQSPIIVDEQQLGFVRVCYTQNKTEAFFLAEEKKLINTIARRIGRFVFYKKLRANIDLINDASEKSKQKTLSHYELKNQSCWSWRFDMAELVAEKIDHKRFGVKALYVIGSTKNGKAGPESDIDLLAHCTDDIEKQKTFKTWIDGWGNCLSNVYKEMTDVEIKGSIIDLHIITDADIKKETSFAIMLKSVSNAAKLLKEYKK